MRPGSSSRKAPDDRHEEHEQRHRLRSGPDLVEGLKVHLRLQEIHGRVFRVVTLRPQTTVRFSTNYFHDTWHILAGTQGAVILARLLWGLSFQRHPGTLVLIDRDHLVPTPFEGDPADPILLVPAGLTSLRPDDARTLAQRLRRDASAPTTIRWHTFALPAALEAPRDYRMWRSAEQRILRTQERMSRRGGFVCLTAPPAILRDHALGIHGMSTHRGYSGYHPIAEHDARRSSYHHDGEFQLIPHFDDDVSAAIVARTEVLGGRVRPLVSDDRLAIYRHKDRALARLRAARAKSP